MSIRSIAINCLKTLTKTYYTTYNVLNVIIDLLNNATYLLLKT